MKSLKLMVFVSALTLPFSAFAETDNEYMIRKAGKCIANYESMATLIEEITEKDLEVMRLYSQVEVAERHIERWGVVAIAEPENTEIAGEVDNLITKRDEHIDEVIGALYSRNLKTKRLRNIRIELMQCDMSTIPVKSIKSACTNSNISEYSQCKQVR